MMPALEDVINRLEQSLAARGLKREPVIPAPAPDCPVCEDMGMVRLVVPYEDPRWGQMVRCPEPGCRVANDNARRSWERRLQTAGLPRRYAQLSLGSWDALPDNEKQGKLMARAAVQLWLDMPEHRFAIGDVFHLLRLPAPDDLDQAPRSGLMLYGPPGTGKTGLIASLINALLEHGESVVYVTAFDLMREIRARFGAERGDTETAHTTQMLFETAPILVIDEFNLESVSEWARDTMERVIRHRHGRDLPTIFTANLSPDELTALWGYRAMDVIAENTHLILVDGPALRRSASLIGGY